MVIEYIRQDIQTLSYHSSTTNMAYHLKDVSISNFTWPLNLLVTYRNVHYSGVCGVWKLNRSALTAGPMEVPVCSHALKILRHFGHTEKSNTSFKSVKTLHLFVCTHNNNTTCFCKIMKANRMHFLLSRSL